MCAKLRHVQPLHQMYQVQHDPGQHSNRLMAPQPQGPMAQVPLITTGTHNEGLIPPQAHKMNNHEVPFYFDSLANSTSKGFTKWIDHHWEESNMLACNKLVRIHCTAGSVSVGFFVKHEANAKTLLFVKRMMVFLVQLTVPSAAPTQLSQCVNPDQLKTDRLANTLRLCGESCLTNLNFTSLKEMTKVYSSSLRSILVHKFSASKIVETDLENRFLSLLHFGSGQAFSLVTHDLSVPGISLGVLQRILSQVNRCYV